MNKLATLGISTLVVAGVIGAYSVSASAAGRNGVRLHDGTGAGTGTHQQAGGGYGRQTSLDSRAAVVGMTADELETALETKTMSEIAKDKGMTEEDFEAKMEAAAEARWEARGLSDEEIAARQADCEERQATNHADHEWGSGEGDHMGGYGRNR